MRYFLNIISFLAGQFVLLYSTAQHTGYQFIENKGQWEEGVYFKTDLKSGYLYLEKDRLLFDLYDASTANKYFSSHTSKVRNIPKDLDWHAYEVQFLGASQDFSVESNDALPHYYNYLLGSDLSKHSGHVKSYKNVKYNNLYESIDFSIYSQLFNLKYDFIVHPGGNPDEIKLVYSGQDRIYLKDGHLHIQTSVNHIIEKQPVTYQIVNGERKIIGSEYVLKDNILSFKITENYDQTKDLIIDPTLIFSTYSGSFSNNFGYTATFDSKGFLYSGSSAFGTNYPTTTGAYSETFSGGIVDIAISKFDTSGTFLLYSTFIGGSSDELPHSLIVNNQDELFIFGTSSSNNYPTTIGCYDNSYNGGTPNNLTNGLGVNYVNGSDIVISRLSADGSSLLASTYLGGSANDGLNSTNTNATLNVLRYNYADEIRGEIDIDANNNIYIATCTRSTDFPITTGAFQQNYGGGALDGCVMKLDNNLQNLIWSSYLGGEKHDAVYALAIDDFNDIYVTGGTESDSLITTVNALDTSFNGGRSDGFITQISSDGSTVLNSSYIGSNQYDQSYFVELDNKGFVYLLGQTEAADSSFVQNVTFSNFGSGQFITKIKPNLDSVIYSTVFGSGSGINISPTAFLVDLCSKMYLAGWGGSVNNLSTLDNNAGNTFGMPITADALQSTTDGSDFYVMVLEDDASGVVYGSYFGGNQAAEHVDGGTSRFDRKGKVYQAMCAGCGGFSDMTISPSNAVSATNNNSCNLGVFKMDFNLPIVLADFIPPPIGCAPYNASFTNTSLSQNNTTFNWDFGDGNTSTLENPNHTYAQPGTYLVQLIVNDTATCNFGDTVVKPVIIIGDTTYSLADENICAGDQIQIGLLPSSNPSITYQWNNGNSLSNDTISNPFATPGNTTTYQLLISNGVCTDTALQTINVNIPALQVTNDSVLCSDSEIISLVANSSGTSSIFIWSNNSNFTDTINNNINDSIITISPSIDSYYYVSVSNNGCTLTDSVLVTIASNQLDLLNNITICEGDSAWVTAQTRGNPDDYIFNWSPSNLYSNANGNDSVRINTNTGGLLNLTVTDTNGCVINDSIQILIDNLTSITGGITSSADTIFEGTVVNLTALPSGYDYSWSGSSDIINPNNQTISVTPGNTTTYTVDISSNNGQCTKQYSYTIYVKEVICGEPDLFIPNAFTPNADNANDYLYVRGNNLKELLFRVYNRWGELVFETTDQNVGWDGTYKGNDCDPDVFVYYLDATCVGDIPFFKKGNITLIR